MKNELHGGHEGRYRCLRVQFRAVKTNSFCLLVFQIVLEVVKLSEEFCELGIVGIFLQDMMEQTHAEHKLVGMFLFLHVKFFGSAFGHRAKVMMLITS